MSLDHAEILESKREFRQPLAARPVAEKSGLLDVPRERQLAIRGNTTRSGASSGMLPEEPSSFEIKPK